MSKVVVYVEHVRHQTLRGSLLELQLPHLVAHGDGFPRDLLVRPLHAQNPGDPLQKQKPDLWTKKWEEISKRTENVGGFSVIRIK